MFMLGRLGLKFYESFFSAFLKDFCFHSISEIDTKVLSRTAYITVTHGYLLIIDIVEFYWF